MPIYEYLCNDCGHEFETLQKVSDAPLSKCPACERDALRKKISAAAFRLSGSGWYETDFKSERKKNLAQGDSTADKPAAGGGDKAAGAKSESSAGKDSGGGKEAVA